jgi:hypothetical protein
LNEGKGHVYEGTQVTEERDNKFTGKIHRIIVELKETTSAGTDAGVIEPVTGQ